MTRIRKFKTDFKPPIMRECRYQAPSGEAPGTKQHEMLRKGAVRTAKTMAVITVFTCKLGERVNAKENCMQFLKEYLTADSTTITAIS